MDKSYSSEILAFLRSHLEELRSVYFVEKIGVFGSHVSGNVNHESDIDVIVYGKNVDANGLKNYLESVFKKPVDVVKAETLYHFMRYLIEQETIYV